MENKMSESYEKMDLYKKCLQLSSFYDECYENFERKNKYGIGLRMQNDMYDILSSIMRINDHEFEERYDYLRNDTKKKIREFEAKFNIVKDKKVFHSAKQYCHILKEVEELNKQCDKLIEYFAKKRESKE